MAFQQLNSIVNRYFPSLTHRNFLIFWSGQGFSVIGTWMQNVGQAWLVLQLTNSPFKLGLVSTIQFLPVMLLSVFAGPFVDRFPKRKVLIFTQTMLMLLAFVLSAITFLHVVQYWHILVLALLLGMVNTFDIPTRQSFVIELAGREDLMNAISLNSTVFNMARVVGPAVAGLLIGLIGIAPCFLFNGISFLAVIVSLFFINVPDYRAPQVADTDVGNPFSRVLSSIGEGLNYIRKNSHILLPLALMAVLSTFVMNFNIVVPTFVKIELSGNATSFGLLMTAMGIGSFAGGLLLTLRSAGGPKAVRLIAGGAGMSLFLLLAGFQRSFLLSAVLLAVTGFFSVTFAASCNAYVQSNSIDSMRGRVMSVYSLVFGGVTPIGSLYAGALVDAASASVCMVVSGAIGLCASVWVGLTGRRVQRLQLRGAA
ncbi:MAG TPA: MFS transporter [Spirochaetia bacterium]|nr:MFS transporter [Spirochaetia bacterium]